MSLHWTSKGHDEEPRDQAADLVDHLWAEVGPERDDGGPRSWSWDVLDFAADNDLVIGGLAYTEDEAKAAVEAWAIEHGKMPRGGPCR